MLSCAAGKTPRGGWNSTEGLLGLAWGVQRAGESRESAPPGKELGADLIGFDNA